MFIPHSYRQMPGTCIYVCECICVFTYHCLIIEGRGRCPRGPAPSGPSGPVWSGPSGLSGPGALGPGHWSGLDGPDRTGQCWHRALAKSSLALSGPVRSVRSAPVPWAQDARTGRTGRDPGSPHLCFCLKGDGALLPNKLLDKSDGVLRSETCFWTKSDGALLQNKLSGQK